MFAFDPDWSRLDESQIALVENWVSDSGGGMIVVPGFVYAGSHVKSWLQEAHTTRLQELYPVEAESTLQPQQLEQLKSLGLDAA